MQRFRTRWLIWALLLAVGIVFQTEARISVGPLSLDLLVAPGETRVGSFQVRNVGEGAQDVTVVAMDYARTLTGENIFLPAGEHPRSLTPYVTFSPATFNLEPEAVQEVQFQVSIPSAESGPHWMMFLVQESASATTPNEDTEGPTIGLSVNISFGVRVRQTDPNSQIKNGVISEISISPAVDDQPLQAKLVFQNTGTAFLRPKGRVEIRDRSGQTVASFPIEDFRILPGASRQITVPLNVELPPDVYIALAIIDFGGDFLVAGQALFSI